MDSESRSPCIVYLLNEILKNASVWRSAKMECGGLPWSFPERTPILAVHPSIQARVKRVSTWSFYRSHSIVINYLLFVHFFKKSSAWTTVMVHLSPNIYVNQSGRYIDRLTEEALKIIQSSIWILYCRDAMSIKECWNELVFLIWSRYDHRYQSNQMEASWSFAEVFESTVVVKLNDPSWIILPRLSRKIHTYPELVFLLFRVGVPTNLMAVSCWMGKVDYKR